MKNPVFIIFCLCSAVLACTRENPKTPVGRGIEDPVALLRSLQTAKGSERALTLERLYLTKEAMQAWNEIASENSERSEEAREHLARLQRLPDPFRQWSTAAVDRALRSRDETALTNLARAFPVDTVRYFEKSDLSDRESARLLAKVLAGAGDHFPQAVMDAMDRTPDGAALKEGLAALHNKDYLRAAPLLERAANPLALLARYQIAVVKSYRDAQGALRELDATLPHLAAGYPDLSSAIHAFRANLLEFDDRFLEAHAEYEKALTLANGDPTSVATARSRRSFNLGAIGDPADAFREAYGAVGLLTRIVDTDTRNQTYGSAANAAAQLGHPEIALLYQNAAVESVQRAVAAASGKTLQWEKRELSAALRQRADILIQLGRDDEGRADLETAADLAEAIAQNDIRDLLRMRILDVQAQSLLKSDPLKAAAVFSEAVRLAAKEDSTYRAILHFKRAVAWREAVDPRADEDIAEAMTILHSEVRRALTSNPYAASEPLWNPYFLRFRDRQNELIESRIAANDIDGALVYDELARAFEPMQIRLQSHSLPAGARFIENVSDLQAARASLPADTVILQYLVLPQRTYTWVITRERIQLVSQSATSADISRWASDAQDAVAAGQDDPFKRATRSAYGGLFQEPLKLAATKTRIVIVPDEPMQGIPFNALESPREGYLIRRASIATTGSTSLYLYALARDRQLSKEQNPTALLVGDPAFAEYSRLPYAREEVEELARADYPGATMLTDTDATVSRFLAAAKKATVIHFAGHALASPQMPWQSRLLLAPVGKQSGEFTAQQLMRELPRLEHTRLVVLGACSTGGGSSLGPQGLAPLVRPLIAADVPAVVGSLWNVKDASAKELLVFLHCHYRNGDDVAVALRNAQLDRLRNNDSARAWAAFQVVGYAASPHPRSASLEDNSSEHLCTQNSLLGPDGLHPQ